MMRRVFTFILATFLLILPLVSCKEESSPSAETVNMTAETVTENFMDGTNSVMLKYPSVSGSGDAEKDARINAILASYARDMYEYQAPLKDEEGGYSYAATDVRVTYLSDSFLSACIGGTILSGFSGNASNFFYTVNLNLDSGELYSSEDILSDYKTLRELFLEGDFMQQFGHIGLMDQMTREDLILQYREEYGILPQVYFTKDCIGFLLEVLPMLDGYAGFTLSYAQAEDCLDKNNPFVTHVINK